ncbi:MAG: hypothetical protein IJU44_02380 [Kiritimatiellae bacterium]|nr:hypothetical protein [Kiritimatiellia bacterium]
MAREFKDFTQLKTSMVSNGTPAPADKQAGKPSSPSDGQYALDYFKRPDTATVKGSDAKPAVASVTDDTEERLAKLQDDLVTLKKKLAAAEQAVAVAENNLRREREEHSQCHAKLVEKEKEVIRRDDRLRTALDKLRKHEDSPIPTETAPLVKVEGLLAPPSNFAEVFQGEIREHLLAVVKESLDNAKSAGRDRRHAVLSAVLAANPGGGELKKRRDELHRILLESGSFRDSATLSELERLGFAFVSGKRHWKMSYAGLSVTIAKTPSDFRALKNSVQEISNRFL